MSFLTPLMRLLPRSIAPARDYEPWEFARHFPYGIRVTTGDALGITRAYSVNENQQLFGIYGYEKAKVAAIAAIQPGKIDRITKLIEEQKGSTNAAALVPAQRALMDIINVHGQRPTDGLHLALALTEEQSIEFHTIGFTSLPIIKVETFNH